MINNANALFGRKQRVREALAERYLRRSEPWGAPLCAECRHVDEIGHRLACWRFSDPVAGEPVKCESARALDGGCGVFGFAWESAGEGLDLHTQCGSAACVDCAHHEKDAATFWAHDVHLCHRFRAPTGEPQVCVIARADVGQCGLDGARGFTPKRTPADFIAEEVSA